MESDERSDAEARASEGRRDYEGDGIIVHWNPAICQHSGICARSLGRVFRPRSRPWVHVDQARAEEIAATVDRCPSGALTYTRIERGATERTGRPRTSEPS